MDSEDNGDFDPVYLAARDDDPVALERLLAAGRNPNLVDYGITPLERAVAANALRCVELLLAAGACPSCCPDGQSTPLSVAFSLDTTRMLIEAGARVPFEPGENLMFQASATGDVARLALLLGPGRGAWCVDDFDPDVLGDTALGCATRGNQTECMALLLAHGADPNLCDPERLASSPLELAAREGNVEGARLLLQAGADPDHGWGLNAGARSYMEEQGGVMLDLLRRADATPEVRRVTERGKLRRAWRRDCKTRG